MHNKSNKNEINNAPPKIPGPTSTARCACSESIHEFGPEYRPCRLTTHVRGFKAAGKDFFFEKSLDGHVTSLLLEYGGGKPALVFCAR